MSRSVARRKDRLLLALMSAVELAVGAGCSAAVHHLDFNNDALHVSWRQGDSTLQLANPRVGRSLGVAIGPSSLEFATGSVAGFDGKNARASLRSTPDGAEWQFSWPSRKVPGTSLTVVCRTSIELNRVCPWIRKQTTIAIKGPAGGSASLKDVVVDSLDVNGLDATQPFDGWQSYPVLANGFYAGVEFPAAQATVKGDVARLACRPGIQLAGGQTYPVKSAVYGVAAPGRSRQAFEDYISTLRPRSPAMHIQYNSWWSAPYPFTQQQMLDITKAFREQYYEPYGGKLDSFCLDMGWAKSQSMWQIDTANFPQGFTPLADELGRMNANLALWVSPSSFYPFAGGLDNEWAGRQGYEIYPSGGHSRLKHLACLAGPRYSAGFRDALVELTRKYRIAHFKFDGYAPTCPETGHGHEPGEYSAEKTAEGFIAACRAIREANPDVWLEATCFGQRPSPWWLAEINSVIGTFGSDAPRGRVPCPVYRESATTGRDFYNLQGARDVLIPIYAQEVLGIIHQTPDPLQNDAVTVVLRGHSFIPMYVNPKFMDARRWRFLASLTRWARQNARLLAHTRALPLGDWGDDRKSRTWEKELPRDPYGYAHFDQDRGLLMLRNPWIRPRRVTLKLDESIGADHSLKDAALVCLYPTFGRLNGTCSYGMNLVVDLKPYETRLLAFDGYPDAPPAKPDGGRIVVTGVRSRVDSTGRKVSLDFEAGGDVSGRQLWLLSEAQCVFQEPACTVTVNGSPVETRMTTSVDGWAVSHPSPDQWVWIIADLPTGRCQVNVEAFAQEAVRFSAWLVAKETLPDDPRSSGPIPSPEDRLLDAAEIQTPIELHGPPPSTQPNLACATQGATATGSSIWSPEYTADKAIDGNAQTRWNSAAGDVVGSWLAVDFGRSRTITEVTFTEAAMGRITDYRLQSWDGAQWHDVVSAKKPAGRTRVICRFNPVTTGRIRLLVNAATGVPTIYEIEAR